MSAVLSMRARVTREDRTARIGMVVFIGGWTMMFAALLVAYLLLRTGQAAGSEWPPAGLPRIPRELPTIATVVLLLSSATMQAALASIRDARPAWLVRYLLVTLALAIAFVAMQTSTWMRMAEHGLDPMKSLYAASFFGLTMFHALHVVVGIIGIASLLPRARRGAISANAPLAVRSWALYWHFVDVVWIVFYVAVVLW